MVMKNLYGLKNGALFKVSDVERGLECLRVLTTAFLVAQPSIKAGTNQMAFA